MGPMTRLRSTLNVRPGAPPNPDCVEHSRTTPRGRFAASAASVRTELAEPATTAATTHVVATVATHLAAIIT